MPHEFWLLGGDERNRYALEAFRSCGCLVHPYGVPDQEPEALPERFKTVVLPFPALCGDALRGTPPLAMQLLLSRLTRDSLVIGGRLGAWYGAMVDRGARVRDLEGTEPLTTQNAAVTAEGALSLAMAQSATTLFGAPCLVVGYGRIGAFLCRSLAALGANVTVCLRSERDQARAECIGLKTDVTGCYFHGLSQYAFVFNTVPAPVFTPGQMQQLSPDCLLVELASAPGGFSKEAMEHFPGRLIRAAGLPGRYAPKTAGELYARAVLKELNKEASL